MFLDPLTIAVSILICVTIWQQWRLLQIQHDLNEITDAHNDFVTAVLDAFEEASADTYH